MAVEGIWQTEAVSPVLPQALGTTALGVPKDIPSRAWRPGGREPEVRQPSAVTALALLGHVWGRGCQQSNC